MAYRDEWPAERWFEAHATGDPIAPDGTLVDAKPVMCPVGALRAFYRVMHLLAPASARQTIEKWNPALWHSMPYVLAGHGIPEERFKGAIRATSRLHFLIAYRTPDGYRFRVEGDQVGFYKTAPDDEWVNPRYGTRWPEPEQDDLLPACREHGHILR